MFNSVQSGPGNVLVVIAALFMTVFSSSVLAGQQTAPARPDLAGRKIVVITGSTDGLGREVALRVGATGAHVVIHGRNAERGRAVVDSIRAAGKGSAHFIAADLGSLAEVRRLADSLTRSYNRIDVLVNNAGIWLSNSTRQLSADGHEMHFAVNYLSGFLLTHLLLPQIKAAPGARIVNVASTAQTPLQFNDIMLSNNYSDGRGYGQSKLAQVIFTMDLAAELGESGPAVVALHPATMMATTMVLSRGAQPRATIDAGADAVMNAIESPLVKTGQYYNGMSVARGNAQAYDSAAQAQLRQLSIRLTGLQPGGGE